MLAAFATLVFLSTLWLVGALAARAFAESGGKIAAALRGHSPLAYEMTAVPIRGRFARRARLQPVMRAAPRLRAAA